MLEATNALTMVDAHAECEECMACRKIHPKTSDACPGQTGVFSTYLCERIRDEIRKVAEEQGNFNIGYPFNNLLLDAHIECAECFACRHLHPKTHRLCPGQTGLFSDFTCEALRRSIKDKPRYVH